MEQLLGLIVVIKYRDGKVYALNNGGLLNIKLLYHMPNEQVKIRNYNSEEHPAKHLNCKIFQC